MMTKRIGILTWLFWIFLGAIVLVGAFGLSSYFTVSDLVGDAMDRSSSEGEVEVFKRKGDVAVLEIDYPIFESRYEVRAIDEAADNKTIKALLVRLNSPGGAVGASQEIFDALIRYRASKKPVYCSFGDVAASGAYYIAAGCEKIYANEGTLTGSIGVIMHFLNLKDLYSWAKVSPNVIKAGRYKDIGSDNRLMTDEERKLLQEMMDGVHSQFKNAIVKNRQMKIEVVDEFADGRIFSGAQALDLGFVDALGNEHDAIEAVFKAAGGLGKASVVREERYYKPLRGSFRFAKDKGTDMESVLANFLPTASLKIKPGVPYFLPSWFLGDKK